MLSVFAEKSIEDEVFSQINIPDFVVENHNIEVKGSILEIKKKSKLVKEFKSNNMYAYKYEAYRIEDLLNVYPDGALNPDFVNLIASDSSLGDDDYFSYLSSNGEYKTFVSDYGQSDYGYLKISTNDSIIGESYFNYSKENNLYPSTLTYTIVFIKDNYLFRFILFLYDEDRTIPPKNEGAFKFLRGNWTYKSDINNYYFEFKDGNLSQIEEYVKFQMAWKEITDSICAIY